MKGGRWLGPVLGAAVMLLGLQLQVRLPERIDNTVGSIVWLAGIAILLGTLRRSMVENGIRLILAAFLAHTALLAASPSARFFLPMYTIAMIALAVGIVGSIVPRSARQNVYGLLIAVLWVVLLGACWDRFRSGDFSGVFAFAIIGAALGGLTYAYTRWARAGELPRQLRDLIDGLPTDDGMLLNRKATAASAEPIPEDPELPLEFHEEPAVLLAAENALRS